MADYFDSSPNFVNPAYATPEQLATSRAYADALTKRSGQNVNRPAGAIANIVDALTAGLTRNNANQMQSEAAAGNARDVSAIVSALQGGQKLDPQTLGHLYANPMASPEARALVSGLITPQPVKSEFGQPGYASPITGVRAAPIQGAFTPGYHGGQGTPDFHQEGIYPAPSIAPPTAPAPGGGGVFGGMRSKPVGWDQNNVQATPQAGSGGGGPAPGVGLPPAPAPAVPTAPNGAPNRMMTPDELAAKGRELAQLKGVSDSQTAVQKQDFDAASTAPAIKRIAGTMLDDLNAHGNNMTWGPTAESANNVKKIIANYAPGLMNDKQVQALASADSFDKLSAQLASMLAKGGGTDAQLFNNIKSVPGAHNAKEGAKALLEMTIQVADQQSALRQATAGKTGAAYEAARNDFYKQNPVVNPISGNPISQDIETEKKAGQSGPISVATPEAARKLPKGTAIRLPDGRTGVVP